MRLPLFIAHRLAFNENRTFTSFIIKIAVAAIAISVSVMIIGTAITTGYQKVIQEKFYSCWGHLHVTKFLPDPNSLMNDESIQLDKKFIKFASNLQHVKQVSSFRLQPCIAKSKSELEGIILKGIAMTDVHVEMKQFMQQGNAINKNDSNYSHDILISKNMANKLQVRLNESLILYFLHKSEFQPKARKVKICGIYATGLEDYDDAMMLCDAGLIASVNDDSTDVIQGYEIYVDEMKNRSLVIEKLDAKLNETELQVYPLEKRFENIFSWLALMKTNEVVIIIIMLIIAIINIVTAFLILILERTQMIGILKALGMPSQSLISIFLYSSLYILIVGISIGCFVGISLCLLQYHFHWIKLNEAAYFIQSVPIDLSMKQILWIIGLTIFVCISLLLIPSVIIFKLSPAKAIRFN
jgi:lipoprotein-releasing system permease protein